MSRRIEDYALIGDLQSCALIHRHGSVDWFCLPRFDSPACFAALLGNADHGCWSLAPKGEITRCRRRYRGHTLILETDYETDTGAVTVIDFMPLREDRPDLVRQVIGRRGRVAMQTQLALRFDYGLAIPWVRRFDHGLHAIAGAHAVHVHGDVQLEGDGHEISAEFEIAEGERRGFVMTWFESHREPPRELKIEESLQATESFWSDWSRRCTYRGPYHDIVMRSLITLKALTYAPTGGVIAAATCSLPEKLGGRRNWDYRYCWIRDAAFTIYTLTRDGYTEEACAWRDWIARAVAGEPAQIQPMYSVAGERRLTEEELPWLPGFRGSTPVRIGNWASTQFQLDVYGEMMDAMHMARSAGVDPHDQSWNLQLAAMDRLKDLWREPDHGIWEMRSEPRHFVHSKIMSWVAADRAVKAVEECGLEGPVDEWRQLRETIHAEICERGYHAGLNSFVQAYDSQHFDAALLCIPLVGFLPVEDQRVQGTIAAIRKHLCKDGLVQRYDTTACNDGVGGSEGTFLMSSCWLVNCLALLGQLQEAKELFERILALGNDVGLFAEEYDPADKCLLGNFPQAFTHAAIMGSAAQLTDAEEGGEHAGR